MTPRSGDTLRIYRATLLLCAACAAAPATPPRALRVCADPNNLPFSNQKGEGLENELARIVGEELHARVEYTWWAQRRGFVRNTLNAGLCDVMLEVPAGFDPVLTTKPYYRSTWVLASRDPSLRSLEDPRLARMKIGVQVVGKDGSDPAPAVELARRGLTQNLRPFTVYGDYAAPDPLSPIVNAVQTGVVDAAVVWGPVAGYFGHDLHLAPLPYAFEIAAGVQKKNRALRDEIQAALDRRRDDVRGILRKFRVPEAP